MIICQSIRSVLDRSQARSSTRPRLPGTLAVIALTMLLSLGTVSPSLARGGDNDDDGLANGDENKYGTNKTVADTDGDGLFDGAEVFTYLTSPTDFDTDRDGVWDGHEVSIYLNPLYHDSDGDQLSDGVEMVIGTFPWDADTDDDGLSDSWEIKFTYTSPVLADTDKDGYLDNIDYRPLDPTIW